MTKSLSCRYIWYSLCSCNSFCISNVIKPWQNLFILIRQKQTLCSQPYFVLIIKRKGLIDTRREKKQFWLNPRVFIWASFTRRKGYLSVMTDFFLAIIFYIDDKTIIFISKSRQTSSKLCICSFGEYFQFIITQTVSFTSFSKGLPEDKQLTHLDLFGFLHFCILKFVLK